MCAVAAKGLFQRIPIKGAFLACCAPAASGAARKPLAMVATNVRRFITCSPSGEPASLADAALLGQEPRDMLPEVPPRFECPRERERVPECHRDLEPGEINGSLGC